MSLIKVVLNDLSLIAFFILRKCVRIINCVRNLSKISEKISGFRLFLSIVISIGLACGVFFLNNPNLKGLYFDNSITGYIAIIGSLPTVYLWIVKEKKKNKTL